MAAPAVQSLQELIDQYKTALNPQKQLINEQIAANDQSGTAQTAGIEANKNQAFDTITGTAQDRGALFSGFTPSEQAKYTATSYLPALAQLQSTIAANRGKLLGDSVALDTSANTNALNTQKTQQSAYDQWLQQQDQNNFTASENEKNRQASIAAAGRSAAAANQLPTQSQYLVQAFQGYDPNDKTMNMYTERQVIPALMATYNIGKDQAANLAYSYRKQVFNQ